MTVYYLQEKPSNHIGVYIV